MAPAEDLGIASNMSIVGRHTDFPSPLEEKRISLHGSIEYRATEHRLSHELSAIRMRIL
jgi:hypothetical protein